MRRAPEPPRRPTKPGSLVSLLPAGSRRFVISFRFVAVPTHSPRKRHGVGADRLVDQRGAKQMFVTEGPLDPESRLFVGRSAELTRMEAWLVSVRCVGALLGARQTGKTSLLLKLRHLLKGKYAFVFVDLEAVAGADLPECITYIASEVIGQLGNQLGNTDTGLPATPTEFLAFLEKCARVVNKVRIVVLLDEIGALSPFVS